MTFEMDDLEMKHYYVAFQGRDNSLFGNLIMNYRGKFNVAEAHKTLALMVKKTCVIISWQEIDKDQANEFKQYCEMVDGGKILPKHLQLVTE